MPDNQKANSYSSRVVALCATNPHFYNILEPPLAAISIQNDEIVSWGHTLEMNSICNPWFWQRCVVKTQIEMINVKQGSFGALVKAILPAEDGAKQHGKTD